MPRFFDPKIAGTADAMVDFIGSILQSSSEYSIIGKDLDGTILLWNEGARRIYGYEPEEVLGVANSRILHTAKDVAAGLPQAMLDAALRDHHWEGTIARRRKDGSEFMAHVVITPRRDDAGRPVGFLLISKDVSSELAFTTGQREARLFDSTIVGTVDQARNARQLNLHRTALANAGNPILITDPEGVILWVNPAFTTTTGYSAEEVVGATPRSLNLGEELHGAESGAYAELRTGDFWETVRSGRVWRGELVNRRKDGTLYYDDHTVTAVRGADGLITHLVGVIHDITERKLAEERLLEAHAQLRELLDHSPAVLYAVRPEGGVAVPRPVSENIDRLLGFGQEETTGRDWWLGQLHPEDRLRAEVSIQETLTDGVSRTEYRLQHKDGTYRWVDDNRRLVRDAAGQSEEMVGVWTDITERKRAQEALRESQRRFREMLDHLEMVAMMLDCNARVTYCNEYLLRLTGWKREEVLGRKWIELFVPPEEIASMQEEFSSLLANNPEVWHHTNEIITRSGERRLVQWNNSLLRSTGGEVIGTASIGEDITSRASSERELRNSEEQLQIIIRASTDAVWEWNLAAGEGYWSDQAYSMLGHTRETFEPTYEMFRALMSPAGVGSDQQAIAEYLEEEKPYRVRVRLPHADGSSVPVLVRGQLQRDTGRVVGVFTDLSSVERAEEQLREQAALIDQAHDAIVIRDSSDRITFWSQGAERLYQWPASDAMGRPFDELLRINAGEFEAAKKAALAEGVWNGEVEMTTATGTAVYVDCRWTLLRDDKGVPKGILTFDTDISERKKATLQLEASEERYRLIFDWNPHPSWVTDLETLRFLAVNQAAIRHYGYSSEEFLTMTIKDIRPPDDVDQMIRAVGVPWNGPMPRVDGVFRHRKKDGTLIDVEVATSRIEFAGRAAALVLASDVTERRRIEQQSLRAQRMESLGTLAGGIAHDLNNLMMPILMGATLLRRLEPGERSLQAIGNIERSVKRGTDLVKQVLLFARGVEGARTAVDAARIVAEVEAIAHSTFPKNIAFVATMPDALSRVIGDETQLTQVLLNLCVNARDAMPGGGQITISATNRSLDQQQVALHGGTSAGNYVVLEVADNGSGIPKEVLDRIFEPFFTTKEVGQGTGLGLSTVQGIVRSHGGFIEVVSEAGRGSSFRVYLPADLDAPAATAIEGKIGELPRGNDELILVVDDEPSILSITRATLEEFGYRVLTAEDGAQAIALYARDRDNIALVLTDMMMPIMDGARLIAALRRINPDVLVIAASGNEENNTAAQPTRTGGIRYLSKPYSADVMLDTLFQLLSRPGVPAI